MTRLQKMEADIVREREREKRWLLEHTRPFVIQILGVEKVKTRDRERQSIPQGGLKSMQYSRSWSCSMGRWVISAIGEADEHRVLSTQPRNQKKKKKKKE